MASSDRIPVTIVSGYLGAGKTTLLNHLLANPDGQELAVVVNDMGEINVDAELLADHSGNPTQNSSDAAEASNAIGSTEDSNIVELSNGCICCRLQDDLLAETHQLAKERSFDHLVVEASGISEPIPVAQAFAVGTEDAAVDPTEHFRLDTMVTVVDAYGFWKEFDPDASVPDSVDPAGDRPMAETVIDQIEFCNVLLLNKCDMVPDDALGEVEAVLQELQPQAELIKTIHSRVDPDQVLDTNQFDFERAQQTVGWKRHLAAHGSQESEGATAGGDETGHSHAGDHDHNISLAERHGVTSFVYGRSRPFHPGRFATWLEDLDEKVVRAKGFCWLAGRNEVVGLSTAGPAVQAGPIGEWDDDRDTRQSRLVFIGNDLAEDNIRTELDDCLATDGEQEESSTLDDPFPVQFVIE
ncbi:CobW family GTP-binding protein [Halomicrococcus sp. NG-SE-24]|uniref:CobW family GTP-binding protein n=1 Tax=Halomicrococcus sp. NG-SE-24 TaxID=3436928 RepID=UPI003D97F60A